MFSNIWMTTENSLDLSPILFTPATRQDSRVLSVLAVWTRHKTILLCLWPSDKQWLSRLFAGAMWFEIMSVPYPVNRRCIVEENETEAARSAGVWICLDRAVVDGTELFKICLEVLWSHTHDVAKLTTVSTRYSGQQYSRDSLSDLVFDWK